MGLALPFTPLAGGFLALDSSDTWVLVAFILFTALLISVGAPGFIGRALDSRAERIRKQLAEARSLREEAQRKLAEAERNLKDAEARSRDIVAAAKEEAAAAAEQARKDMDEAVARRLTSASDRIARAEDEAVRDVRNKAVDAAVGAVREVLAAGDPGLDPAVKEISAHLSS